MKKTAFLYPGVGSHHAQMGKELYEDFDIIRHTFEEASDSSHIDFAKMCFAPPNESVLGQLINSQSALLVLSVAVNRLFLREVGINPEYAMGYSLGEYSALCSAGVISFPDSIKLVNQRGKLLNDAAESMVGIMAWLINLDTQIVEKMCIESREEGHEIFVSAYDAPKQSSISGSKDAVFTVGRKLEQAGAIVYPLKLSGPFHSIMMKSAGEQFKTILQQYSFNPPTFPVIANYSGLPYDVASNNSIVNNLFLQLINPILWKNSIDFLINNGVEIAVELGPDKVLKHLLLKNTPRIQTFSLGSTGDLKKITEKLLLN